MNNQTIIILVVAVVIIIAIVMMNQPKEQVIVTAPVQPEANVWNSLGAIAGILSAFGIGGNTTTTGDDLLIVGGHEADHTGSRLINNVDDFPLPTQKAATEGFEYLVESVNGDLEMDGTQFN